MGIKAEPDMQKHEPGYAFNERQCDICQNKFKPQSPNHAHCCYRCAFIAVKLGRPAAKRMDRDVAIAYYGRQYDDPLRHVKRGTTKQLIRHIMNYCEEHDAGFVTKQDIKLYANTTLKANAMELAMLATPALTHFATTIADDGTRRELYLFDEDNLVTNADAQDLSVRRYRVR